MSNLFFETTTKEQREIFEKLPNMEPKGTLGGGTAIALQIGHRRSVDLDVFLDYEIPRKLAGKVNSALPNFKIVPIVDNLDELTFTVGNTKLTFVRYPFPPLHKTVKTSGLPLFSLPDLASNKAYTIGRRGSYKDYVDIYFLLKSKKVTFEKLIGETKKRFKGNFSEKLFLQQLNFMDDITDFAIDFLPKKKSTQEEVSQYFKKLTSQRIESA